MKPKEPLNTFEWFVLRNSLQLNLSLRNGHVELMAYKYLKSRSNRCLASQAEVLSHLAGKCQPFQSFRLHSTFHIPHSIEESSRRRSAKRRVAAVDLVDTESTISRAP